MLSLEFKRRIQRLDPSLYVDDSIKRLVQGEWHTSGLFSRKRKRSSNTVDGTNLHYAGSSAAASYLQASETGHLDQFVCGVPFNWVPEYDVFDLTTGKILARGWRSIVSALVKQGHCSWDRARKVFQSSELGRTSYDRMTYEQRLAWARSESHLSPSNFMSAKELLNAKCR